MKKGFLHSAATDIYRSAEAKSLSDAAYELGPKVERLRGQHAYSEALAEIAKLRPTIDAFFDKVMILDSDPAVRGDNLALIERVQRSFSGIADFSEIVTA